MAGRVEWCVRGRQMPRYVAFLRAINVGGHIVKMDRLRTVFEDMGFERVATFIASGNVIFQSSSTGAAALEKKIASALEKTLGYPVATFVRSADEVARIAEHKAYEESDVKDGTVYVCLLPDTIAVHERKVIAGMESPVDTLRVNQREIYWHARENFSGAKFSPARLEKVLGKPSTFRNVTTMRRIAAILSKP
jgi:uncharacterized protein (DUF1697 family)